MSDPVPTAASFVKLLLSLVADVPGMSRNVLILSMELCGKATPNTILGEFCRHWAAAASSDPEARAAFVAFLLRPLPPVDAP